MRVDVRAAICASECQEDKDFGPSRSWTLLGSGASELPNDLPQIGELDHRRLVFCRPVDFAPVHGARHLTSSLISAYTQLRAP